MSIFLTIVIVLVGIIALLLVLALLMRKTHSVTRDIIIDAPQQKVFAFIKLLQNQDQWNKWAMADPGRNIEYKGTDGTVGFLIAWNGNKDAGEGEKEIVSIVDGKSMESQIRFVKPMATTSNVILETAFLSDNRTKVSMNNSGSLSYPMNLFIPIAEKKFPKDMDESLSALKKILEKQ